MKICRRLNWMVPMTNCQKHVTVGLWLLDHCPRIGNLILILHNLVSYHAKEDTIRHTHTVYKECHIFGWNSWRHSCIALRCVLIQSCPLTIYCIVASRNISRLVTCLSNWCDLAPSVLDNKNVFYELYYNMYHVLNWNKRLQIKINSLVELQI